MLDVSPPVAPPLCFGYIIFNFYCNLLLNPIFYSFLVCILTLPIPWLNIPNPIPVSLISSSASVPNLSLFLYLLISLYAIRSFNLRYLLPPLFFFLLSSGIANGLFNLAGGGSCILLYLYIIFIFNSSPADPFGHVFRLSILAALATLVANILTNYFCTFYGAFYTMSNAEKYP